MVSSDSPPAPAWRRWLAPLLLMAALTVVLSVVRGEPLRRLERSDLEQAIQKWSKAQPPRYSMTVKLEGRQSSTFEIEVDQGEVVRAIRDGEPLSQQRTQGTWSVDGMFDTLLADMEMMERQKRGETGTQTLKLLAVIDDKYGLPRRYLRIEMLRKGANPEAGWHVLDFQPQTTAVEDKP